MARDALGVGEVLVPDGRHLMHTPRVRLDECLGDGGGGEAVCLPEHLRRGRVQLADDGLCGAIVRRKGDGNAGWSDIGGCGNAGEADEQPEAEGETAPGTTSKHRQTSLLCYGGWTYGTAREPQGASSHADTTWDQAGSRAARDVSAGTRALLR